MPTFIFKPLVALLCLSLTLPSFANVDFDEPPTVSFEPNKLKLDSIDVIGDIHFTPPIMHRFDSHGVPVLFTPIASLPMVDISLNFLAGSAHDDITGVHGSANMVATMLTQGTQSQDEDTFIAKKEQLGIHLSASAGKDNLSIHLRSLSEPATLQQAIELMGDAVTKPRFDGVVLARNQSQLITAINQRRQTPNYVASVALGQAVFGSHPYAHPITGTTDDVAKLSTTDLHAFSNQFLVADNATLTITGDLNFDAAKQIADTLTAKLPKGNKAPRFAAPTTPSSTHIHINHPSPQTVIMMANLGDPKANDDAKLQTATDFAVANDVLAGGEFSARLMKEIRVNKGYTYGIYGSNQTWADTGIYTITFSTQAARAGDAIADVLQVITDTQQTGISSDELKLAIFNSKNSFPQNFASNASLHTIANMMNIYQLPQDFLINYQSRLDNVSLERANAVLNQQINPDGFVIISVGESSPVFNQTSTQNSN